MTEKKDTKVMLAVQGYKRNQISSGRAAELAGLTVAEMMHTLAEYGVKNNLDKEDYLKGLENLRKAW